MLRLFASYANETSYTVWESLTHNLTTLGRLLSYTDYYQHFKGYAVKLFTPTATRLGWDPKDTDSKSSFIWRTKFQEQSSRDEYFCAAYKARNWNWLIDNYLYINVYPCQDMTPTIDYLSNHKVMVYNIK